MGIASRPKSSDRGAEESDSEVGRETGPDRDELFHVLRNQRRRFAIHHLKRGSDPVEVGDLATQIAAWENGISVDEVTSTQRRRVYNALKQTHIPELDETGLVEEDRGEVVLTDQAEQLDVYLELVPEKDIRWSEYYLGLGAVGLAATVASWFDPGVLALASDAAAGVFLSVALIVSAVAQHYYYRNRQLVGNDEKPPELRGE